MSRLNCGPTPSSPLPCFKSTPRQPRALRNAYAHHLLWSDAAFLTSPHLLKPTGHSNSSSGYGRHARLAPFPLFVMDNVDGWIDFPVPLRRSLVGFGGVDVEEDGPSLGRYRHHTCYQATTCNSNTLNSTYSVYLSLHWATRRRGREESTFGSRFGPTTFSDGTLNLRRTERPGSGALNKPWDVKEALGVWKKRLRAQRRMRS